MNIEEKIISILREKSIILKEMYKETETTEKSKKSEIRNILTAMVDKGTLYKDSKNKYHIKNDNEVIGNILFTKNGNMAFVKDLDGTEVYVGVENSKNAMHGDKVLVIKEGKWRDLDSGKVIRILKRNVKTLIGKFEKKKFFGFVIPINSKLNADIYIPPEHINGAKENQIVKIEIIKYKQSDKKPEGKIVEILGYENDPNIDLPIILSKHGLPAPGEFPLNVKQELKKIDNKLSEKDYKGRTDFRNLNVFTIDGDTAKDFDDAVSILKLKNGNYKLGVHIADVSNYVKEGSNLDKEAYRRSTSVYLIDTVIPMIPHELSDWMCSLVQGEDRLTTSIVMEIDKKGNVVDYELVKGVIKSVQRLTYTNVNKLLSSEPSKELIEKIGFLKKDLLMMKELMNILREQRKERGSILDIESGEIQFVFDDKGRVKDIIPVKRGISEVIIEEFMIKANETVAGIFSSQELPFIYRIHEDPDSELVMQLKNYLEIIGVKTKFPKRIHPKLFQEILEKVKNHPLKESIQKVLVKTMKRAIYSSSNTGHFGLASKSYTHFTSPIRRYPDLLVHRMINLLIEHDGTLNKENIDKYSKLLPEYAISCSDNERVANEAEWDLEDMKKVEYISNHLNEEYEVFITGVTKFGLFVEIPKKMINGLIHISDINDYLIYREKDNVLISEKTGVIYRIGGKLKAKVVKANKLRMEVDFVPVNTKKVIKTKVRSKAKRKKGKRNKKFFNKK